MLEAVKTLGLIRRNQKLIEKLRGQEGLLGRVLRMVEIETHSYCNRICSFCPNSFLDRRSERNYLPPDLYTKILRELKDTGYIGSVSFVRYMEPLADEIIFDRVREAHEYLPKARLIINTNGDFFSQDILKRLDDNGLTELNIARYIDLPRVWSVEAAVKLCETYIEKHRLKAQPVLRKDGYVSYRVFYRSMEISLYSFNYVHKHNDRGASLQDIPYERRSPCSSPFTGLYFDANGECMPCCNMRSDHPDHKPFSYGNIRDASLLDLFLTQTAMKLREDLSQFKKPETKPCQSCAYRTVEVASAWESIWNLSQGRAAARCAK